MSSTAVNDPAGPLTSKAIVNEADRLKTLQAQIEARKQQKRKREGEAGLLATQPEVSSSTSVNASPSKGKGRAVSFAEEVSIQQDGGSPPLPAEGLSQQDAFKASKAEADAAEKSKATKKTKAKARYLKAKMARYKAKKRVDKQGKSEAGSSVGDRDTDMNDTMMTEDGEEAAPDTSVAVDAAEEKRARKMAKREERRAKEALEAETSLNGATSETVNDVAEDVSMAEGPSKSDILDNAEKRKAERKAKKAAKNSLAEEAVENGDTSAANGQPEAENQVLLKRDLAVIAKAEELKARQEKANKRAKAKLKYGKVDGIDEDKENEDLDVVPTQPDALPRFPKPVQPVAPSQRELDDLLISHDLRHAVLVDQTASIAVTEMQNKNPNVQLSEQTLERLREMNVEKFFAVQSAVLPVLLENKKLYTSRQRPRDVCVSAPTGSGKTLSYVIPVVETLRSRVVTRLRALVVLPTRELVTQVRDVFEQFCKGTGLKVAAATGQHSFSGEQSTIVEDHEHELQGGSSKVDILVVTPGRLMDHLKSTRNFTLQHLRFLVIDEADRLLSQNFNDWLKVLISHIEAKDGTSDSLAEGSSGNVPEEGNDSDTVLESDSLAPQLIDARFPLLSDSNPHIPVSSTQKLLFSATLTRDPARISALNLHKPVYIAVVQQAGIDDPDQTASALLESDRNFALPETLKENMIVTRTSEKALMLLYLLYTTKLRNTLCFTKSIESAGRLVMLVDAFNTEYAKEVAPSSDWTPLKIAHYSSELGPAQRKEVMDSFKKGEIHILVCSDIAARGLDIPTLENVVNYDVPVDMRKYVHRVGRTARAGRAGTAWSLVEVQEAKYFKTLLSEAGRLTKVKNMKFKRDDLTPYKDAFESALTHLQV